MFHNYKVLASYRLLPDNKYISYVELHIHSLFILREPKMDNKTNLPERCIESYDNITKKKIHDLTVKRQIMIKICLLYRKKTISKNCPK